MSPQKSPKEKLIKDPLLLKNKLDRFPIVGIGASAGGLEALKQFFANIPSDTGMAYVIIQHLDPHHFGMMPELLQRITTMKVVQATENLQIKPNCIYVIPPNKSLSMLNGVLHLYDTVEVHGIRMPIDIFFRSLANEMNERSIGIILSGMGSDGTLGCKAIKEKNGLVLVQDPATAKFDGMPRSASESVAPDIIASAEELPAKLIERMEYKPSVELDEFIDKKSISSIEKIIILLRDQCGHDFSLYKKKTLFRRIERRKSIHQFDKIQGYVMFLQQNPQEIEILFKELLIGVTSFFRDTDVWIKLRDQILSDLLNNLPNGYLLRAWVPACSTGEEAYSWAITFKEAMDKFKNKKITLQLFATDLDRDAIEKARKGFYTSSITNDVSPERLKRFFTQEGEGYRINSSIREMVVFAPQNVIKDPPFTKLDILSCRNMLIYMESELQQKIHSLFFYSLNPGGVLLLGTAETTGNQNERFKEVDSRLKIYYRTNTLLEPNFIDFPSSYFHRKTMIPEKKIPIKAVENIQLIAEQILLQRFTPASVLVNHAGDILYITGRTGKYLEPVAGKANWNIYVMAHEGFRHELPSAFRKAMQNYNPVYLRNIKLENSGTEQFIDVTIQRMESPEVIKGMIMVVFTDVVPIVEHIMRNGSEDSSNSSVRQKELEIELQRSFEDLQSAREEMQTSQEELKSANEELQSTNEELQSTNEELTTSKEEMQSINEELQTVNYELQSKVNDLIRVNDDMKNLLNSTEIATLFLDKELNIRKFTDQVVKILKLRNSDIGRPFMELVSDLNYPEIAKHALQVIQTLIFIETAAETHDGRWFNVRIMPYRTLDDRIDGLVITFTDITIAKKLEIKLQEANEALRNNLKHIKSN